MANSKQDNSERASDLFPVQVKMARVALGWGVRDLAAAAKVSGDTVNRLEQGEELRERTLAAVREALETAGVEFLPQNGGGPGVRLRYHDVSKLKWTDWRKVSTEAAAMRAIESRWPEALHRQGDAGEIRCAIDPLSNQVVGEAHGVVGPRRGIFTAWEYRVRIRPSSLVQVSRSPRGEHDIPGMTPDLLRRAEQRIIERAMAAKGKR